MKLKIAVMRIKRIKDICRLSNRENVVCLFWKRKCFCVSFPHALRKCQLHTEQILTVHSSSLAANLGSTSSWFETRSKLPTPCHQDGGVFTGCCYFCALCLTVKSVFLNRY